MLEVSNKRVYIIEIVTCFLLSGDEDMSDALRTFLQLGSNAALGADEHQWILYRAEQPVSYVRSTKAVLVRCIREKSIELSVEGKAALDALADDFSAWKADPTRRGTPVAPRAELPLAGASDGRVAHFEARGGVRITMIEELGPDSVLKVQQMG